jgi:hypothetical protein
MFYPIFRQIEWTEIQKLIRSNTFSLSYAVEVKSLALLYRL